MRILVTGATGYLGGVIAEHLHASGHTVLGTSRSAAGVAALEARGLEPVRAELRDADVLHRAASSADAVVHAVFGGAGTDLADAAAAETDGVTTLLASVPGPLVYLSGVGVIGPTDDRPATEDDPVDPPGAMRWRRSLELATLDAGGVVVRPGMVHGRGGGFVLTGLIATARDAGAAHYLRPGDSAWPTVHVDDVAALVRSALDRSVAGRVLHAVAETSSPRRVTTAIARLLGLPSATPADPAEDLPFADLLRAHQSVDSTRTRDLCGWTPTGPGIEQDVADGSYAPV